MSRLSQPVRIAICLAFLSINVLLCAQIFGLIPGGGTKEENPRSKLQQDIGQQLSDAAATDGVVNVPDPYFRGGFDHVYSLVEAGCAGLLAAVQAENDLSTSGTPAL